MNLICFSVTDRNTKLVIIKCTHQNSNNNYYLTLVITNLKKQNMEILLDAFLKYKFDFLRKIEQKPNGHFVIKSTVQRKNNITPYLAT